MWHLRPPPQASRTQNTGDPQGSEQTGAKDTQAAMAPIGPLSPPDCVPVFCSLKRKKRRKVPDLGSSTFKENVAGEVEGKSWKMEEGGLGDICF